MNENPFRQRTVVGLSIVAVASLVAFLVSSMLGEELVPPRSAGPSAYSRSAIGYHAFAELLRRNEIPVTLNRHVYALEDSGDALVVITEPRPGDDGRWGSRSPDACLGRARNCLLVLPKWDGVPAKENPEWVERVDLVSRDEVVEVIRETGFGARVNRLASPTELWDPSGFTAVPTLPRPQLLVSPELHPVISTPQGILLGRLPTDPDRPEAVRYVLSDPDLLANHGLDSGLNAVIALELIHLLTPGGQPVIFDETVHGMVRAPSVWGELLRFPLGLVLLQAGIATSVLLWGAMRRFGAPLPTAGALRTGKRTLIDNTADLLFFGGHHRSILRKYLQFALRSATRACHLPPGLTTERRAEHLRRIGEQRGATITLDRLHRAVVRAEKAKRSPERAVLAAASLIHQWRKEMTDGTR